MKFSRGEECGDGHDVFVNGANADTDAENADIPNHLFARKRTIIPACDHDERLPWNAGARLGNGDFGASGIREIIDGKDEDISHGK